jgi:branched-chain amino acid transport system permease protein
MTQIILGLSVGAAYSLMAVGVVLIYKCTRALSIVQGELGAFGLYYGLRWTRHGLPLVGWHLSSQPLGWIPFFHPNLQDLLAGAIGVFIAALLALVFERTVMRALVQRPPLDGLIATLGIALFLALAELQLFGTNPQDPGHPVGTGKLKILGATLVSERIMALGLAALAAIGITLFFQRTKFGLAVLATTSDPTVAKLLGVPVNKVYRFAWVVGGVLSGFAAALLAPAFGTLVPFELTRFALAALAGAVVGGLDSVQGAIIGSLLVGVVETEVGFHYDPGWAAIAILALVLGTLVIRPQGILGTASGV